MEEIWPEGRLDFLCRKYGRMEAELITGGEQEMILDDLTAATRVRIEQKKKIRSLKEVKENAQEISLLDGIDANHIVEAQSQIEQPEAQKPQETYPILGVDNDELK